MKTKRGYFGIGIENGKTLSNLGTLWRSANILDASFIFTTGKRYAAQASDTLKTPRHIPLNHYTDFSDMYNHLPHDCQLVGVELVEASVSLPTFKHPERAVYLLGAEDHGLSADALKRCHRIIQIPTAKAVSLNVAVAGSLVMYDRFAKENR